MREGKGELLVIAVYGCSRVLECCDFSGFAERGMVEFVFTGLLIEMGAFFKRLNSFAVSFNRFSYRSIFN